MNEIKNIVEKIQQIKENINKLIEEKENLQDEEILTESSKLDILLNKYNNLLTRKLTEDK